jgi:hypothetical protein
MKRVLNTRPVRRILAAFLAGALALVGTLSLAAPAQADIANPGWYMLVSNYYDGYSGSLWCLSTNAQQSNSGAGTHFVYLSVCKAATPAQWWYIGIGGEPELRNYQDFGNDTWDLSANNSTPAGGAAGTYGAYTASSNPDVDTHRWFIDSAGPTNQYFVTNYGTVRDLSVSASNPEIAGTLRVYTAASEGQASHIWRLYQPAGRPSCTPCG